MMNIAIQCDIQFINIIKRHIHLYFQDVKYVDEIKSHTIVIKEINILKDIQKIDLIKDNQIEFVFLINNGEYMFELLEYKPLCFLRKNNLEKDLNILTDLLQYKTKNLGIMLEFKSSYQQIRINALHIEYIESLGHYLLIHTESATFKVREKISTVLTKLEPLNFIRVHKSYIVNQQYIKSKTSHEIILNSHTSIPIGKKYK